jgi:hypothetical protein
LVYQPLDHERFRLDDCRIVGERCGTLEGRQAFLDQARLVAMMFPEEGEQCRPAGALQLLEAGPMAQEVAEQRTRFLVEPRVGQGKVLLQRAGQAVGDPRLLIDEFPSLFQQAFERANADTLWLQGFQLVAVAQKDLQRDLRIGRIGLGVAGLEGLSILRQSGGIHRKQDKEVMFLQRVDQRSAGDLETDGHRLA